MVLVQGGAGDIVSQTFPQSVCLFPLLEIDIREHHNFMKLIAISPKSAVSLEGNRMRLTGVLRSVLGVYFENYIDTKLAKRSVLLTYTLVGWLRAVSQLYYPLTNEDPQISIDQDTCPHTRH